MKPYESITLKIIRRIWWQWRYEITGGGKLLIAGVFAAMGGTIDVSIPVYNVFFGLFTLLLVVWGVGLVFRPRVRLSGEFSSKAVVGEPVSSLFHVENASRLPAYDVSLGFYGLDGVLVEHEPGRRAVVLGSGESADLPVTLVPQRRGLHEIADLRAYSTFPFDIGRFGRSRLPLSPLLVVPDFHPLLAIDIPVSQRHQPGGITLTSNVGESPEYIGNREYVPGDSPRRIDFRSWARLARPVVREFQEEYFCRVALIVDTFVPGRKKTPPEGFPELEAAISMAAAIANSLASGEYILDIFAAGPELYVFRTGRQTAPFDSVLEILACVDACRDDPFEVVAPALADELGRISAAVCVFLDWDASRQHLARTIQESGCRLKTILIRDGEPTDPIDEGEFAFYTPEQVRSGRVETI